MPRLWLKSPDGRGRHLGQTLCTIRDQAAAPRPSNHYLRRVLSGVCWGVILVAVGGASVAVEAMAQSSPQVLDGGGGSFVEVVAKIRPSVVAVGSYYFKDRPTAQYFGTGFVVHDGHTVVTNAHVVEEIQRRDREGHLRVFFPDTKAVEGREATILGMDRVHDVAVLRFEGPAAEALPLILNEKPRQGQSVAVLGYPIGFRLGLVPAVHSGIVAAIAPAVLPLPAGARMTPKLAQAIREPYEMYQLNLVVFPGNSGSPLFDAQDGRVWGIINKALGSKTREHMIEQPTGISYAVPAWWIHELVVRSTADETDTPETHSGE